MKMLCQLPLRLVIPAILILFAVLASVVSYWIAVTGLSGGPLHDEAHSAARNEFLLTTLCLIGLAVLISWFLDHSVSRRVDRLIDVTRHLAAGELEVRASSVGQDELAEISRSINAMARTIEEALRERRHFQQASEQAHALLATTVDALSYHIVVLDEQGTILAVNAAWKRFAEENGLAGYDFIGRNYLEPCESIRGPEAADAREASAGVRQVLRGLRTQAYHEYACHLPGNQRWFGVRTMRVIGDGPARAVVAHEEVTPRVLAEQMARGSVERYRGLVESSFDLIFSLKPDGQLRFVNRAWRQRLDYGEEEVHGLNVESVVASAGRDSFTQALGGAAVQSCRAVFLSKKGEEIQVEGNLTPQRGDGQVVAVHGFFRDITARLRAEEEVRGLNADLERRVAQRTEELSVANAELAQAGRHKDEFLASMSHELRTPLNGILSMAEGLEEQVYGPIAAEQKEALTDIRESGRHLLTLINDILDLSKIEAGQLSLDLGPASVPELCQASLRMVKELALKKRLQTTLSLDESVSTLLGDQRRLKQVLVNLLSNAVKFTPEGGSIGLDVVGDFERGTIALTVWDTGIGISQDDLPRLFRPFTQLDSKLSRQYSGTGLGLVLVWRMVRMHGGSVTVESEPGSGSRFTVSLPWTPVDPEALFEMAEQHLSPRLRQAPEEETVSERADGRLVLLAEDNEVNARGVMDYLKTKGYQLALARDGDDAVAKARTLRPELILMDVQMPGSDGLDATRRLRAEPANQRVPIIAITALAMPGDRERCFAAGADAYLSKPIVLRELSETMTFVLSRRHGRSESP